MQYSTIVPQWLALAQRLHTHDFSRSADPAECRYSGCKLQISTASAAVFCAVRVGPNVLLLGNLVLILLAGSKVSGEWRVSLLVMKKEEAKLKEQVEVVLDEMWSCASTLRRSRDG